MKSYRDILLKILSAIEYTKDKDTFIDAFLKNIQLQSYVDLSQSLSVQKQAELKQRISENTEHPEVLLSILKADFSQQELSKSLETAAKNATVSYIQTILPTLSTTQRDNLLQVLKSVVEK